MKKQLGKRIISGLLTLGMILSPTGAGLTAVPAFAEDTVDSSISETLENISESGEAAEEPEETSTDSGEMTETSEEMTETSEETTALPAETTEEAEKTAEESVPALNSEVTYGWVDNGDGTITYTHSSNFSSTDSRKRFSVDIAQYYSGNLSDIRCITFDFERSTELLELYEWGGGCTIGCMDNPRVAIEYKNGFSDTSLILGVDDISEDLSVPDGETVSIDLNSMVVYDKDTVSNIGEWTNTNNTYTYTHNNDEPNGIIYDIYLSDFLTGIDDCSIVGSISFDLTVSGDVSGYIDLPDAYSSNINTKTALKTQTVYWNLVSDNAVHDYSNIRIRPQSITKGSTITISNIKSTVCGWVDNGDGTFTYTYSSSKPIKRLSLDITKYYSGDIADIRRIVVPYTASAAETITLSWEAPTRSLWNETSSTAEFANGLTSATFDISISEYYNNGSVIPDGTTLTIDLNNIIVRDEASCYGWFDNGDDTATYKHSSELNESERYITLYLPDYGYNGNPSDIRFISIPCESTGDMFKFTADNASNYEAGTDKNYIGFDYGMSNEVLVLYPLADDLSKLADGTTFTFDFSNMNIYTSSTVGTVGEWVSDNGKFKYTHNGAENFGLKTSFNLNDYYEGALTDITAVSFDVTVNGTIEGGAGIWDGTSYPYSWIEESGSVEWTFENGFNGNGNVDLSVYGAEEGASIEISNLKIYPLTADFGWTDNGNDTLTYIHSANLSESQRKITVDLSKYYGGNASDIRYIAIPSESSGTRISFTSDEATNQESGTSKSYITFEQGMSGTTIALYPFNDDFSKLADGDVYTFDLSKMTIYTSETIDTVGTWTDDDASVKYTHNGAEDYGLKHLIMLTDYYDGELTDITAVSFDITVEGDIKAGIGIWDGSSYAYEWIDSTHSVTWEFPDGFCANGNIEVFIYRAAEASSVEISNIKVSTDEITYGWIDNSDGTYTYKHSPSFTDEEKTLTVDFSDYYDGDAADIKFIALPIVDNESEMYMITNNGYTLTYANDAVYIDLTNEGTAANGITFRPDKGDETIPSGASFTIDLGEARFYDSTDIDTIGTWTFEDGKYIYTHNGAENAGIACPIDLNDVIDGDLEDMVSLTFDVVNEDNIVAWIGSWDGTEYRTQSIYGPTEVSWEFANKFTGNGTGVIHIDWSTVEGSTITFCNFTPVFDIPGVWTNNGNGNYTYKQNETSRSGKDYRFILSDYYDGKDKDVRRITFDIEADGFANGSFGVNDGNSCWQHSEFKLNAGEKATITLETPFGVLYGGDIEISLWWVNENTTLTISNVTASTEDTGLKYKYRDYNETTLGTNSDGSLDMELYTLSPEFQLSNTDIIEASVTLPEEIDGSKVQIGISLSTAQGSHIRLSPSAAGVLELSKTLEQIISTGDISPEEITGISVCVFNADDVLTATDELGFTIIIRNGDSDDNKTYAVTVSIGDDTTGYETLDDALAAIKTATGDVTITLNEDAEIKTLTLPTKAKSVTIKGEGKLTISGASLTIPCDTVIENTIVSNGTKPMTVKVAGGKTLTLNGKTENFGAVSGTATSKLVVNTDTALGGLATFGEVTVADGEILTVSGAVKGVGLLNGTIKLTNAGTTAAITNIGTAEIILVETEGKLPKTTVTNVNEALAVTVENETGKLASGTAILYTVKEKYTDKITITNKTDAEQELDAFLYKTEIRAEYAGAVSVNGKNYPNLEKALEDVTDPAVDYAITLNEAASVKNLVMPKKAASVTIDGADLTIGNTKLALSTNTTLNSNIIADNKKGTLDISAAKGITLTIGADLDINALSGAAGTSLVINSADVTVKTLSKFDSVSTGEYTLTVTGSAKGITTLDGIIKLTGAKTTAAITNIGTAKIILAETEGKLPKATVANVNEALTVTVENETGTIASGTPILYAVKEKYTDKITITNKTDEGQELNAFLYKKEIRAEYAGAVSMNGGNYPNLEKAFEAINEAKDNTADYVITLNADVTAEKFTLPKTAASITFRSENGSTINVGKATSIAANTDLTIENIAFVTTGKSLTINAKKNLTVDKLYGNVTAVKGAAKFALNWNGEDENTVKADITGFGTVNVADTLTTGKVFNVTKLVFKAETATLVISDATAKASVKAIDAVSVGIIEYAEGAKTALAFTGKDTAFTGTLTITGTVANGQAVLTAKGVDTEKLANGIEPANPDVEYIFKQIGKDICYIGKVLEVSFDEEEPVAYATWGEVVAYIEKAKNSEAGYMITLLDNYNANGAIKFPKAGTYKSITITSVPNEENVIIPLNFNFTGNLVLTASTTFSGVNIGAVKNGKPAKYTINAGKNAINILCSDTGMLTSINGTGFVGLFYANAEKIKAGDLYIGGQIEAIGGITAKNVIITENTDLFMSKGSKLAITGNVTPNADCKITVVIFNKTTGITQQLKAGDVIGTIKGTGAENIVLNQDAYAGLKIENVKGKLVVVKDDANV
ncbi:MAG: hypothetical protein IJC04_03865 [Oscillospiraceae bacterium]|nr:hypothetical protein [Oscillospiraceae bacterium]